MKTISNIQLKGEHGKPVLLDVHYVADNQPKPVVVFAHGFKGFKDWGHWSVIADHFANEGFIFLKFNFSHNGTTPENPTEFGDLEAFGQNNFTKELADFRLVLDWLKEHPGIPKSEINLDATSIIGHSRGGAIALLEAHRNPNVKQLITWASVQTLDYGWTSKQQLEKWKEKGAYFILNGRTFQEMPMYYQMYEDFMANKEELDVKHAAQNMNKPFLIIHGESDPAVPIQAAYQIKEWAESAQLLLLAGADHVFGGKHPYELSQLPEASKKLVEKTIAFIKEHLPKI